MNREKINLDLLFDTESVLQKAEYHYDNCTVRLHMEPSMLLAPPSCGTVFMDCTYSAFVLIFDRFEGFAPSFFDLKLPRSCGGTPKRPQLWEDPPVWVEQGCALSCLTARNSQQNLAHANCYWRAIAGLWANDRSDGREKAEPGTFAPHGGRVCTSFLSPGYAHENSSSVFCAAKPYKSPGNRPHIRYLYHQTSAHKSSKSNN